MMFVVDTTPNHVCFRAVLHEVQYRVHDGEIETLGWQAYNRDIWDFDVSFIRLCRNCGGRVDEDFAALSQARYAETLCGACYRERLVSW